MAKKKVEKIEVAEDEATSELYYEITAQNGDVYLTINAGRGSHIRVMSGQPSPPNNPPKG